MTPGTVDVGSKPALFRIAKAEGTLNLREESIAAIRGKAIQKGDALEAATIAGILAMKNTANMIPYCHPIPLEFCNIEFELGDETVTARSEVRAHYKTGVEMEALVGVATALLTVWDMVKYLEKDDSGQYPTTRIQSLQVISKEKKSDEET